MDHLLEGQTENQQSRVEDLAQLGATPEDIAMELQIPLEQLEEPFHPELERGVVKGKHLILRKLFENASSASNMSATARWVKARWGWRDTGSSSNSPSIIHSFVEIVATSKSQTDHPSENSSH